MADVCGDILDKLAATAGVTGYVSTRMYAGKVPSGVALPFIWMARRGIENSGATEAETNPLRELVVVECVSDDSTEAVAIADAVRTALNGIRGLIGSNAYSWVGVSDMVETYTPRNLDADEFLHIYSLDIEAIRP